MQKDRAAYKAAGLDLRAGLNRFASGANRGVAGFEQGRDVKRHSDQDIRSRKPT
jgi:hypothetical protein